MHSLPLVTGALARQPLHPRLAARATLAALVALVALALGCGRAARPPETPGVEVAAPYPFSVYDIRAGCPLGRVIEYRIEEAGAAPRIERWAFKPLDPDTVSVTTTTFDLEGKPVGPPRTESATWIALHEHARFPRSATTISNESLTISAGTFDVMRYDVRSPPGNGARQGDGQGASDLKTYWFARSLPGPPVKLEVVKDGKTVMTFTMQANRTH